MKLVHMVCAGVAAARRRCCGARWRQGHSKDHDQSRDGDAGRRLPALRQRLCRNHERGRSDAVDRAAQHQGQQREYSAAGGRQSRYRAGRRRAVLRSLHGHRPAGDAPEDPDRDVFEPRHVRGARRQSVQDHSRSRRQAGRVRRQGLRPSDPVALHARRSRPEAGRGFPVDLSRPRRRRSGDGARRTGRRAVGRRHRLARIRHDGRKSRRRAVHRARCRRDRAHQGQALASSSR